MARQIIMMDARLFENIQAGTRTWVILENDRIWSTYDQLWFVECNDKQEPTDRVIRVGVSQVSGSHLLPPAHCIVSFYPLGERQRAMGVEHATAEIIEEVNKESLGTLLMPGKPRQLFMAR